MATNPASDLITLYSVKNKMVAGQPYWIYLNCKSYQFLAIAIPMICESLTGMGLIVFPETSSQKYADPWTDSLTDCLTHPLNNIYGVYALLDAGKNNIIIWNSSGNVIFFNCWYFPYGHYCEKTKSQSIINMGSGKIWSWVDANPWP